MSLIEDTNGKVINILGSKWTIEVVKFAKSAVLKDKDAAAIARQYCRTITISDGGDKKLASPEEIDNRFKHILRHEIVHAFLTESGLAACGAQSRTPWPKNEEMVDWIAKQLPKISKVYEELDILED